ncbi:putative cobalt transporter CbtA [Nocardioides luteus]|uniref:Membrane protein n=1 Tax=Nocardioides luteus TaxID=1844 RepID=A0ABQ5T375_9ACTN|nr:CbtA family protein [Nocardioides luteus]MDR7311619.1 putative cobalt transporter CbtA [Nocardioides luteus]GGR54372.1 membrane protein [Nocardioides luteus]GLJ70268.1 membrane protein [Nocardioides luteus]
MSARAFLVRGLLAGLLAGIVTFMVAYAVGEPQVGAAIALEEAGGDGHSHSHAEGGEEGGDEGGEEAPEVSRTNQSTWGLLTGTLAIGVALGGIVALVAAVALGRIGRLSPGQSTALVTLIGFVAFALVPFLKYPATPPAVGSGDTIGLRTSVYFGYLLVSVVAAALATYGAVRLRERFGTYAAVVGGTAAYLVVVVVAGQLFATVNEIGDFPADTLWSFRLASLITLATMWGVLGVALTGLIGRLHRQQQAVAERKAFAASL